MGIQENETKTRRKKRKIQQAVLATIGTAGIVGLALIAPNIFQMIPGIMGKERYKVAFQARTALQRLQIKGLIRFVDRNGFKCAEITEKGRSVLAMEQMQAALESKKNRRWDKQYRVVAFDIPEKRKYTRDRLRGLMEDFGFLQMQKSMWLYPYDCEDLIALVKAELRIGKDVVYMIVDSIENDRWIKNHFNLKA